MGLSRQRLERVGDWMRRQIDGGRRNSDAKFIRVRADKLDRLLDLVGELVIASSGAQLASQQDGAPRVSEATQRIHDLVQEARDGALAAVQPVVTPPPQNQAQKASAHASNDRHHQQ